MKLRLFYRGEKEYRQKRKAIKRHDSDGETESEPEEKKVERRKKKFRLGLHEDQSFVDSPDAIYMWQFEATHPYTWLSGKYNPGTKLSEIIKIFQVLPLLSLVLLVFYIPFGLNNFVVASIISLGVV